MRLDIPEMDGDANYIQQIAKKTSKEALLRIFGKPYYTYHPFIFERFMSTFVAIHNLKLVQI